MGCQRGNHSAGFPAFYPAAPEGLSAPTDALRCVKSRHAFRPRS